MSHDETDTTSADDAHHNPDEHPMIRVVLADDQRLVRTGFEMILSTEPDLQIIGQAENGSQAIELAERHHPDVVLMDVQMPGVNGIEATSQIVAKNLAKVIIVTTFDRDDYIFDGLNAGASGFVLKNADPDELINAVRAVAAGDALLSPKVTLRVIRAMSRTDGTQNASPLMDAEPVLASSPAHAPSSSGLTERETQVLTALARGLSNTEIAAELVVSEATVKTHVSNLLSKLGLRDRVQAVAYAFRNGLAV